MKFWQLISKSSLKLSTQDGRAPKDKEFRVKINKLLLTPTDLLVYDERITHPYPFIPARFAIGTICEGFGVNPDGKQPNSQYRFYRNEKVILRAYFRDEEDIPLTGGVHTNGVMRDFAYLTQDQVFHIPPTVREEDALYLGLLSLAEAAIEASKADEGDFVLVSGEDVLSLILCQLLLYYKIVPVLVTASSEKVNVAKSLGIFYAFEANDALSENVFRITGGKNCDSAIYCNSLNRTSPSVAMNNVAHGASVVFLGSCDRSWPVDSSLLTRKALSLSGIYSGYGYEHTALGILANRVIDFGKFDKAYAEFDRVEEAYARLAANPSNYHVEIVSVG